MTDEVSRPVSDTSIVRVARKVIDEFARLSRLNGKTSVPRRRCQDVGAKTSVPRRANLSKRELEVLALLVRGVSNKEIAIKLDISDGTVRNHLTHIYRKLGVTDRVQAVLQAREYGIA